MSLLIGDTSKIESQLEDIKQQQKDLEITLTDEQTDKLNKLKIGRMLQQADKTIEEIKERGIILKKDSKSPLYIYFNKIVRQRIEDPLFPKDSEQYKFLSSLIN